MTDESQYIAELCEIINAQGAQAQVTEDMVAGAQTRDELGITSLGVIMLVAEYMESHGVPQSDFNPDWVTRLDSVVGILSVMRDIHPAGASV